MQAALTTTLASNSSRPRTEASEITTEAFGNSSNRVSVIATVALTVVSAATAALATTVVSETTAVVSETAVSSGRSNIFGANRSSMSRSFSSGSGNRGGGFTSLFYTKARAMAVEVSDTEDKKREKSYNFKFIKTES